MAITLALRLYSEEQAFLHSFALLVATFTALVLTTYSVVLYVDFNVLVFASR